MREVRGAMRLKSYFRASTEVQGARLFDMEVYMSRGDEALFAHERIVLDYKFRALHWQIDTVYNFDDAASAEQEYALRALPISRVK
jgi:hypothetical protein